MASRRKPAPPPAPQVPAGPPVRVDIRVGGRLMFSDDVYGPGFDVTDDTITFTAARRPTMVDAAPPPQPATRFVDQTDPRDQAEVIQTVHSGRRDIPAAEAGAT